ncbi:MAG: hypothetical protein K6C94_06595 [Candidatus Gastranaerophilales bacterium]|nr:hypothetical protein [Candidatus Gastranaerophilales bacterium]
MKTKKDAIEYTETFSESSYMIKPLEHKGFNRHFINLVSADVFMPKKFSFFGSLKNLFGLK